MSTDVPVTTTVAAETEVLFGRSNLLKVLGVTVFGAVISACSSGPSPYPCYGYISCWTCTGTTCTDPTCKYDHSLGCETGFQCWYFCSTPSNYACCDWERKSGLFWESCICSSIIGKC
jgi:hypothetical protein